jgi:3-oxoacyl-[acyl-carrier-protein] synthase II
MADNGVVITGIGLVSSIGEGVDAHWRALREGAAPILDRERFAPYLVHPLPEIDWNLQIPKRGDQRQMETWQRLGTYAAGLALDDAGVKTDEALCASMDLIVAAGGGERDVDVDTLILSEGRSANDREVMLNQKLMTELRPTLFLAQLSNLLAGNISIVHKVTGSSRTFMGEEGSGISAVEIAAARIRAGQSTHAIVGGAYNAEHPNMLLGLELGGHLQRGDWGPIWHRGSAEGGGVIAGSGGAFLVLESRAHAEARDARIHAVIETIAVDQARRDRQDLAEAVGTMLEPLADDLAPFIVSSASGAHEPTTAEQNALDRLPTAVVRGICGMFGYMREAQFPFALAIAALAVSKREVFPQIDREAELTAFSPLDAAIALTVGIDRAEGAARVVRA